MVLQTGPGKRNPLTMKRARRLRKDQTVSEMLLWRELRRHGINDLHFRRQVAIGPFIVDFYCAKKKLIIELDGYIHQERDIQERDRRREQYLRNAGYRVLRFTNDDVNDHFDSVLREITEVCGGTWHLPSPPLSTWKN